MDFEERNGGIAEIKSVTLIPVARSNALCNKILFLIKLFIR